MNKAHYLVISITALSRLLRASPEVDSPDFRRSGECGERGDAAIMAAFGKRNHMPFLLQWQQGISSNWVIYKARIDTMVRIDRWFANAIAMQLCLCLTVLKITVWFRSLETSPGQTAQREMIKLSLSGNPHDCCYCGIATGRPFTAMSLHQSGNVKEPWKWCAASRSPAPPQELYSLLIRVLVSSLDAMLG